MSIKSIFLDRDGVINKELNYVYKIEDFEFIEGIFSACQFLQKLDYKIIIITNQSGIDRKLYSDNEFHKLSKWMVAQFKENNIDILDIFYCPHKPESNCECRKPNPGMILKAREIYNIDLQKTWIIGDKENDIIAGYNAGIQKTVIVRSGHNINESSSTALHIIDSIKDIDKVILQ